MERAEDRAERRPLNQWMAAIDAAERSGDVLQAADLSESALTEYPENDELKYHHLLSLARGGALVQAEKLWPLYGLPQDDTRYAALGARLLRERAFRAGPGAKAELLLAAEAYARIFHAKQDPFPGINAAVLLALASQQGEAQAIARKVQELAERRRLAGGGDPFNLAADLLTSALILDEPARAAAEAEVLLLHADNAAALASTRRQLRRLTAALGRGEELLQRLAPRASLHFTGHMLAAPGQSGRFPAAAEAAVAEEIGAFLDRQPVGAAYGSLASGADILIVEALARRGIPFHLVLPFDVADFLSLSVEPAGPGWKERFEALLPKAASLSFATEGGYLGDAAVFGYCARLAMGLARLRARMEDAESLQLAIWDGEKGNGLAGTAADIALWQSHGLPSHVISSRPGEAPASPERAASKPDLPERPLRAFLFGDFRGFSKLSEAELLSFNAVLLPAVARVLDREDWPVEIRQTWGDGVYLVFPDVARAAACALALQAELATIELPKHGLPELLGLRAAMHAGPVFVVEDPVMRQRLYTGRHISRAARMEPVTPEGELYVSEGFAALLALEARAPLSYEYVGRVPLAKNAGHLRMYLLRAG
jgi:class 3 adenylate cyclase